MSLKMNDLAHIVCEIRGGFGSRDIANIAVHGRDGIVIVGATGNEHVPQLPQIAAIISKAEEFIPPALPQDFAQSIARKAKEDTPRRMLPGKCIEPKNDIGRPQ